MAAEPLAVMCLRRLPRLPLPSQQVGRLLLSSLALLRSREALPGVKVGRARSPMKPCSRPVYREFPPSDLQGPGSEMLQLGPPVPPFSEIRRSADALPRPLLPRSHDALQDPQLPTRKQRCLPFSSFPFLQFGCPPPAAQNAALEPDVVKVSRPSYHGEHLRGKERHLPSLRPRLRIHRKSLGLSGERLASSPSASSLFLDLCSQI
mmetsp:Transcript_667/g.2543  ORF Transcript_667/g.2543 Transcript_667/m.2543 type:complete len:206 (+) Transcript_667:161-778(+)|eukprot:scaffold977_cov253-Pinguiococcus_pyrenoidosus.AAC.11